MTYQLSNRLFLENGPAVQAAAARARRAHADAYYLAEAATRIVTRIVTGAELPIAA